MLHGSSQCYTDLVPTTRPRHTITETSEVSEALAEARKRWPEEGPAGLLRRLVEVGHQAVVADAREGVEQRLSDADQAAGSLSGVYPDRYLERLRDEWPQ